MKAGSGKKKGSQYEREISVTLSKWLSHGRREDVLWRSAMSGGRATVARKKDKVLEAQSGDLTSIHPLSANFIKKFYIELKFYRDLNYAGLIIGNGKLSSFWKETKNQALFYQKCPILIAKQNRYPTVLCLDGLGCKLLGLSTTQTVIISYPMSMFGFLLDDFIKQATPF